MRRYEEWMIIFLSLLLAYLIGSIPFGLLLTKAAGLGDIRQIGSGNIGATNVLRTGNKKLALLTLLLDGGKGWLAVKMVQWVVPVAAMPLDALSQDNQFNSLGLLTPAYLAATGAVMGHVFSCFLRFKGGKGVATALGAILALTPMLGVIVMALWLAVFLITRLSSLSAIVSLLAAPFLVLLGNEYAAELGEHYAPLAVHIAFISLLVIYRHKENIRRLMAGTEPKFGKKP